jgi:rhamnogalacturonan endolyase
MNKKVIETFVALPIGELPYDYSPIGEYHFVIPKGTGNWIEVSKYHAWRRNQVANWNVVEEDGNKVMEQSSLTPECLAILVTGEYSWMDYTLDIELRPLSTLGISGIIFRYNTSNSFYALYFEGNAVKLAVNNLGRWKTLGIKYFSIDYDRRYHFRVELSGSKIFCYINEALIFSLEDDTFTKGKVGLLASCPCRYYKVSVEVNKEEKIEWIKEAKPGIKLWKKIYFPKDKGAGRSIRFGDLNSDGRLEFVLAQNIRRAMGDNFCTISYMCAYDLDGNILWEIGEPSSRNALVTNDLPFQIYDIDNDGNNEVVCIRNFEIQILDGRTGKIKERFPAPKAKSTRRWANDFSEDVFYRIAGDSIMFCNVSGKEKPGDILIKDRYHNAWIYNNRFELLWEVTCNTGHYPCAYDIDSDGKDEILIGYTLFDDDGSKLWELPDLRDHADGIVIADIDMDNGLEVVIAGGDDGILISDINGNVIMRDIIGHAQTPSVARFLPEIPGLQICTITFWKYPGTICLYDAKGNRLKIFEIYPIGSPLIPVNWKGDGQEYILFSGDINYGGLFDGAGRKVLSFPDDDHPVLCCTALNLVGDARDEIILWDTEKMYIYTQDSPFEGDKIYVPRRNPLYNESNYKGIISM